MVVRSHPRDYDAQGQGCRSTGRISSRDYLMAQARQKGGKVLLASDNLFVDRYTIFAKDNRSQAVESVNSVTDHTR